MEQKEKNLIIGLYIKQRRMEENMSISFLSEVAKISKGFLSEIERGRRKPAEYTFNQILKTIDIPFYDDENYLTESKDAVNSVIKAFIDMDKEKEKEYLEKYLSNLHYKYSLGFYEYNLLEFAYLIRFGNHRERMLELVQFFNYMDKNIYSTDELLFLYDLLALFYMDVETNYLTAQEYLESALMQPASLSLSCIKGVIMYHLIDVYQQLNAPVKALLMYEEAEKEFTKSLNIKRLFHLNLHKAHCLSRLKMYDEAEKIYLELINQAKAVNIERYLTIVYDNLAWNSLKNKNYKDSILYTKKSLEMGSSFNSILEYIPFSYFKMNQYDECIKAIKKIEASYELKERQKLFFDCLISLIERNKEDFEDSFLKYFVILIEKGDYEMIKFMLMVKYDYYLENQLYYEACQCMNEYFKYESF